MARRPIDEGIFIDAWWRAKKSPYMRIRIVQLHRKDRSIMYETELAPGLKLVMKIAYLRQMYDSEAIYIK